jgi:hypothetical protein
MRCFWQHGDRGELTDEAACSRRRNRWRPQGWRSSPQRNATCWVQWTRPRAAEQYPGGLVPVRHWRQRCQLFHLWRRVTEPVPECSAGRMPLVWADLRLVRQDKVRLQRGVIEIRDATLTREWVTPTQLATLAEQVTVSGGLTGGKAAPHSGCPRTRPRARRSGPEWRGRRTSWTSPAAAVQTSTVNCAG